ncbi:MAG: hypothetical protein NTV09_12655 [Bacteroidetes bacterium]|nr:hypothetical protein [Bacteroidota bacterium]
MNSYILTYLREIRKLKRRGLVVPSMLQLANDYGRWKKWAAPGTSSVQARLPWMTFSAIRFMEKNLDRTMKAFEYGCGGSTVFLCERAGNVVSVEHDKEWFQILGDKLKGMKLLNWQGKFIEPESTGTDTKSIADPDEYGTDDVKLSKCRFKNYASSIDEYKDEEFDWVLVDGRSRPSCIKHAIPKVKVSGFLLLDNSDRQYYLEKLPLNFQEHFRVVCDDAGPASFMTEFSKTTIWQKVK